MTSRQIRQTFLDFFKKKGHIIVPSSSLIPADPSVLFTTAGMQQFIPYLSGDVEPPYQRACSIQKCFRTSDIDKVGDTTHHTFFEMLGNWAFGSQKSKVKSQKSKGSYWKKEAIEYALELLVDVYGLSKDRLWVTVFKGDKGEKGEKGEKENRRKGKGEWIPRDQEAIDLWIKAGILKERIKEFGMKDNFWGPTAEIGPCGPCSEIHYDRGKEYTIGKCTIKGCGPNCGCGRFVEIWNLVFMEYMRIDMRMLANDNANGVQNVAKRSFAYKPLPQKNIDTGIGFERLVAILQDKESAYETDLFLPIIDLLATQIKLPSFQASKLPSCRIIVDHIRGTCFLIADGILPSKKDQGYVLRRILRRTIVKLQSYKVTKLQINDLAQKVIEIYQDIYPELKKARNDILTVIQNEEEKFGKTLSKGVTKLRKITKLRKGDGSMKLSGEEVFHLFDTYGFPLELTKEMVKEKGLEIDEEGFKKAFERHQKISRAGAEKKFGGHNINLKSQISNLKLLKLHTATHLLHQALRDVLGDHVKQMGSDINPERLRFDFSHPQKLTEEEKMKIEKIVNQKIKEDLLVTMEEMNYEKALESKALAFFREKYPKIVKVYSIGSYSREVCAGPHVERTGEIGGFKIISEKSSSAGVRRIKGVLYPL